MGRKLNHALLLYVAVTTHTVFSDSIQWGNSDASSRNWNHAAAVQSQQQPMQPFSSAYMATTNLPASPQQTPQSRHDADSGASIGVGRNFDSGEPPKTSASSDEEIISRHYGYYGSQGLNIHRFNPNFPHYDMAMYPRHPFSQVQRYGPGYRKDKYGHGYGYSCKQGDDCDKVRAANQFPSVPPALPPVHHPPQHFGSHYPDYPSPLTPFSHFGNQLPSRFHDAHFSSPPSPYYHGRYVHEDTRDLKRHQQHRHQSPMA